MIGLTILLTLYMLPTIVALARGHHQGPVICIINLFAGWTLIGWLIAICWSVSHIPNKATR